jgi:hypothetical protein
MAGDALPDRIQAGSLFYIGLRSVERCPKVSPTGDIAQPARTRDRRIVEISFQPVFIDTRSDAFPAAQNCL